MGCRWTGVLGILALLCSSQGAQAQEADWTFLVYMVGDSSLARDAFNDFNEMEIAGSTDRVNIVVQFDWTRSAPWSETRRYLIDHDEDPSTMNSTLLESLGETDMGDPATLRDFALWGIENFPAQHYALIGWGHGNGWSKRPPSGGWKGFGNDDSSGNDIGIADGEMEEALQPVIDALGRPLDILGFDACLMAMWEVGHAAQPFADYLVASEETEDARGWLYNAFLVPLIGAPDMDPATFCTEWVEGAYQSAGATLSCVDLSHMDALAGGMDSLASAILQAPGGLDIVRSVAEELPYFSYEPHTDLVALANGLGDRQDLSAEARQAALAIPALVEQAVVINRTTPRYTWANGIAVYLPLRRYDSFSTLYAVGAGATWSQATRWEEVVSGGLSFTPDIYEDDDDPASATELVAGQEAQQHNFIPSGDQDWLTFPASSERLLTFNIVATAVTAISVYGADGVTLLASATGTAEGNRLDWLAPQAGTYLAVVSHPSNAMGQYTLALTEGAVLGADAYEVDDGPTMATPLAVDGESQEHTIFPMDDQDWLAIAGVRGLELIAQTQGGGITSLALVAADGQTLIASADGESLTAICPSDDVLYLRVTGRQGWAGAYTVAVAGGTLYDIDAYEPDDTADLATPLEPNGEAQAHSLVPAEDVDWFTFEARTSAVFEMATHGTANTTLTLYDNQGQQVARDSDSGEGRNGLIRWISDSQGPMALKVANDAREVATYTIDLTMEEITDDHPNAADLTGPEDMLGGQVIQGEIELPGDRDYFQLQALAGETMTLLAGLVSISDTYMYLYAPNGTTELAHNDDSGGGNLGSRIQWTFRDAGTYYIMVRHYSATGTGTYTLEAQRPNSPPVALAGEDRLAEVGVALTFDGRGSHDDGAVVSHIWDFGDGARGVGELVEHMYAEVGVYTVTLVVEDEAGLTGVDRLEVDVAVCVPGGQAEPPVGICETGPGVCGQVMVACEGGEWGCEMPSSYGRERCDGLDNNCDGVVDEGCCRAGDVAPEGLCSQRGVCVGVGPACQAGRWTCVREGGQPVPTGPWPVMVPLWAPNCVRPAALGGQR